MFCRNLLKIAATPSGSVHFYYSILKAALRWFHFIGNTNEIKWKQMLWICNHLEHFQHRKERGKWPNNGCGFYQVKTATEGDPKSPVLLFKRNSFKRNFSEQTQQVCCRAKLPHIGVWSVVIDELHVCLFLKRILGVQSAFTCQNKDKLFFLM